MQMSFVKTPRGYNRRQFLLVFPKYTKAVSPGVYEVLIYMYSPLPWQGQISCFDSKVRDSFFPDPESFPSHSSSFIASFHVLLGSSNVSVTRP
jgi:hypothetical protein